MTNEELLEWIKANLVTKAYLDEKLDEVEESIVRRVGAIGAELDIHKRDPHAHRQAAE